MITKSELHAFTDSLQCSITNNLVFQLKAAVNIYYFCKNAHQ